MSQRSGGNDSFWSSDNASFHEKEIEYRRAASPAPLSPLPSLPEADGGINGLGGKSESWKGSNGNAGFSLFPPPTGWKNSKPANFPRDF